jgi:hypothetical protein
LSVPNTFVLRSTTAEPPLRPSSVPSLAVPIQWLERRAEGETRSFYTCNVS